MKNPDKIYFKDVVKFIQRKWWLLGLLFSVFFAFFFYPKMNATTNIRVEQGVLIRNTDGRIVPSENLFYLKRYFFQNDLVADQIAEKVNHPINKKDLILKVIPFGGPAAMGKELENGYILSLRVDAPDKIVADQMLQAWIDIMRSELVRIKKETKLDLNLAASPESNIILKRSHQKFETLVVSLVLATFSSFFSVLILEAFRKHL